MLCPQCQTTIDPGSRFCGNCGFQIVQPASQQPISSAPQALASEAPLAQVVVAVPVTPPSPVSVPPPSPTTQVSYSPLPQPTYAQPYQPASLDVLAVPVATPGYAVPRLHDHSGKAITSFILGVLGVPACLVPIVGIVFGILAIIFGTLSIRSARRVFAIIGMSLAVLVILASLFLWVRNSQELAKQHSTGKPVAGSVSSGKLQPISTPCYTTKIPAEMRVTQTAGSCTFLGTIVGGGEQEEVKVLQVPGLTAANLATAAKADALNVVGAIPGGKISKQATAVFAGSQAYQIEITSTDGSAGTIDYVYDTTAQGNMVIVLHTQARTSGSNYSLDLIESSWAWL